MTRFKFIQEELEKAAKNFKPVPLYDSVDEETRRQVGTAIDMTYDEVLKETKSK